ncbi:MAG TPA: DUF177 domain-containing protein [Bacillota bacterium]
MRIDIGDIRKQRGRTLRRSLLATVEPLEFRGERIRFEGPLRLDVRLHNAGGRLWADVAVHGRVQATCARCLKPVERAVEFSYSEAFRRPDQEPLADEGVRETVFEGDEIDLSGGFEEQVLLALPMRDLCRPDCRGLCPVCGADLNEGDCGCDRTEIDPRFAPLAELLRRRDDT